MAQILLPEGAAPSTPAAGYSVIYPKADGFWYSKDDAGVESVLSGASTTGYPTVASSATIDIFGAAGATIDLTGTVTVTGITACTASQVGSIKRVIPSNAAGTSFTASANITVDGLTSGTFLMPLDARIEVLATSTTTFEVRTVKAEKTFTPEYELGTPGTSSFGTYAVQLGTAIKEGRHVTAHVFITGGTFSVGTGSGVLYVKNLPWTNNASLAGSGVVNLSAAYVTNAPMAARISQSESRVFFRFTSGASVGSITEANCANALRTEFIVEYLV